MNDQMIHHSALSFKQLRSLKITDRLSCCVVLTRKEMASPALLSQYQFFGQFGAIHSIRILEVVAVNDPQRVFVRFTSESSAMGAIAWCKAHPLLFMDAGHGYQKYCPKFLNKRQCTKANCRNRHSWGCTADIQPRLFRNDCSTQGQGICARTHSVYPSDHHIFVYHHRFCLNDK